MDGLIKSSALPKFTGEPKKIERDNQQTLIIPQYEYVVGKPGAWPVFMGNVNVDAKFTEEYGFQRDTTLVQALLKSYQDNRQSGGVDRTLPIDMQHAAGQTGTAAAVIGEIVAADVVIEDGTGVVKLYKDGEEQTPKAEIGDAWLVATCGFYEEYYQMLKDGKIGYQPSIFFSCETGADGKVIPESVIWQNLGVVQVPAVGSTPILALNSQTVQHKADAGVMLELKGVFMDEMTKASLQSLLTELALPQPDIDIILAISQEAGTALLTKLQGTPETTETVEPEQTVVTVEDRIAKLEEVVKSLALSVTQSIDTTKALVQMSSKGVMLGTVATKPPLDKNKRIAELKATGMPTIEAIAKVNKEAK